MQRRRKNKERTLIKMKRRAELRRDFIAGNYSSQAELAVRYGISPGSVSKYLGEVVEQLKEEDKTLAKEEFMVRKRRLENIYANAETSYQLSKQPEVTSRTQYQKVLCPECGGTGWEDGDEESGEWCVNCDGDKEVVEEVITQTVKGQAGDSSFLQTQLAVIKELNKLQGMYPEKKPDQHLHLHQGTIDLSGASNETLLKALDVMDELKNGNGEVKNG